MHKKPYLPLTEKKTDVAYKLKLTNLPTYSSQMKRVGVYGYSKNNKYSGFPPFRADPTTVVYLHPTYFNFSLDNIKMLRTFGTSKKKMTLRNNTYWFFGFFYFSSESRD